VLAFEMDRDGYRFLRPSEKNRLVPVNDGPLAPRYFPPRMQARFEIDGQVANARQALMLDPGGLLPGFNIVFNLNDTRWWVLGGQDGKIRSLPTADAHPG